MKILALIILSLFLCIPAFCSPETIIAQHKKDCKDYYSDYGFATEDNCIAFRTGEQIALKQERIPLTDSEKEAVYQCKSKLSAEDLAPCFPSEQTQRDLTFNDYCYIVENCVSDLITVKASDCLSFYPNEDRTRHLLMDCEKGVKSALKKKFVVEFMINSSQREKNERNRYAFYHGRYFPLWGTRSGYSPRFSLAEIVDNPFLFLTFAFEYGIIFLFIISFFVILFMSILDRKNK